MAVASSLPTTTPSAPSSPSALPPFGSPLATASSPNMASLLLSTIPSPPFNGSTPKLFSTLRVKKSLCKAAMGEPGKEVVFAIPPSFYLYKDGSTSRGELRPPLPPSHPHPAVSFKELTLNAELGLWARLYLPPSPPSPSKLPLVLFFHGGGFIMGSPAQSHLFCTELSKRSSALWVSASYRLAPEHRLPAAFDDAFSTFQWLHSQALLQAEGKEELMDPWLARADFSKFFVAGVSAGGNIAHRVTIQALNKPWSPDSWSPICIRGLIPIHAAFVRHIRTQEEEDSPPDIVLNWQISDMLTELGMPLGSSGDHPFMNPLLEFATGEVIHVPPKALVGHAEKDILHFMGQEYAKALEKAGCSVDVLMSYGVGHIFFNLQPNSEEAEILYEKIANFIAKN